MENTALDSDTDGGSAIAEEPPQADARAGDRATWQSHSLDTVGASQIMCKGGTDGTEGDTVGGRLGPAERRSRLKHTSRCVEGESRQGRQRSLATLATSAMVSRALCAACPKSFHLRAEP